ncbi:MAG TPA: hypothetical protein P5077_03035 [bacterium]|nr:hypothetical protein [bacterium]
MNMKKLLKNLAVLFAMLVVAACTTERSAVDKTEELALDKKLFDGEFFYRQTVTDLPYTADFAFIGESNDGKIIRWKITKNWLIAYNVHDKIDIVDTAEQVATNETPILAYPIAMHFDILPQENPTTGEDMPMLVPNTDKPWNERRYFVIDHSGSAIENAELKYLWMTQEWDNPFYFSAVEAATDMEFYAHDGSYIPPKKYADMLAAEDDPFNKEVEWFQFRSERYLVFFNNWNSIYSWADIEEFINTEPARMVSRHTFKKINRDVVGRRHYDPATQQFTWKKGAKDNGFRPLEFPDELFREFGYFTNLFKGYDPESGYKEKDYHELANYFNIAWAKAGADEGVAQDWNFTCAANQGTAATYNACLANLKYQQKMVFTSSAETPKRMLPANCAITKDYNHAMLAARFAAMNPGSDTREFEKWYVANYKNDFFKDVKMGSKTVKVRDMEWYLKPPAGWESKCFYSNKDAFIQKWSGDLMEDNDINEIVVFVKNPVEAYIPARDGKHLDGALGYDAFETENNENAFFICTTADEAQNADEGKISHFENCYTNEEEMTALYTDEFGRSYWKGDRYDCKVLKKGEACPAGYEPVKAACEINDSRTCRFYDNGLGLPKLRHRYMNGGLDVALINWVDQPTEYGILGVSQWNVNPETGQTLGAGSNIAGSVLQWVMSRTVELARILIDEDDPAAWDWEQLIAPEEYSERPSVVFQNSPAQMKPRFVKNSTALHKKDLLDPLLSAERQTEKVHKLMEKISEKQHNYKRFDYNNLMGTKWEREMVPYSMRTAMFPWSIDDDQDSWVYSDGEMSVMRPFVSGPEAFNIEMLRYLEGMKMDFFMDETFLDGAIIQYLKQKMTALRKKYPNYETSDKEKYVAEFVDNIFDELEPLTYKGVAEHEMGHSVGLRHNFSSSADQMNYHDEYFATGNYPAMLKEMKEKAQELNDEGRDPATWGREIYNTKRSFESKMNYYTYVSIMDYQREAYIHAVGLGKYDKAALKFAYGRTVEQYRTDDDGFVEMDETNPLRDAAYPFPVLINRPFIDSESGKLAEIADFPRETITYEDPAQGKVMRVVAALKHDMLGRLITAEDGNNYKTNETKYLVNDGSIHKYIFFSDEKQTDEPINKIFDAGYTGADSVRFMSDTEQSYYFMRFFRRGNPKFREFRGRTWYKMILDTLLDKYKYVHYLLDFNYNVAKAGWFGNLPIWTSGNGCGTLQYSLSTDIAEPKITLDNAQCIEYLKGMQGIEYWLEGDELKSLTPFGMGDYIVAGMVGVNHFLNNVLYRPDVTEYLRMGTSFDADINGKIEASLGQEAVWVPNPYILDGETIAGGGTGLPDPIVTDPVVGRYHRDHYWYQDDPSVYYDKVVWRGFSEEKAVAIFALSNQGWLSDKYGRESMANGLGQMADGIDNLIFAMFGDIANEDSILSFTPYCIKKGDTKIVKVELPVNTYLTFNAEPPFYTPEDGNPEKPSLAQNLPKNICAHVKDINDPTAVYEPVHAGWIYFDKLSPMYWGIGNVMNASADTSVLLKFGTFTYGTYRTDVKPADIDEVEVINSVGNMYYRAKLPQGDLSEIDIRDLVWWKERKAVGASDADALCLADPTDADADGNADGYAWTTDDYGPVRGAKIKCARDESNNIIQKYDTKEEFRQYLEDSYARFCPAYRLVRTLSKITGQGEGSQAKSDPSNYKVTVIETTLEQLNAFIADHFGTAVMYAYFI